MSRYWLVLLGLVLVQACSSPLIKEGELEKLNKQWSAQDFVTRQDIKSPVFSLEDGEDVIFQKGTKVKVWVESAEDWIRVKAYPASETREQTRGRTIIYIFNEDLKEKDKKPARVQEILRNKFNSLLTGL